MEPQVEAVYRLLLDRTDLGVPQLCRELGLAERDVREALDRLAELTLLRQSRDEPGRLRALSLDLALDVLLRRREQDVLEQQHHLAAARLAVARAMTERAGRRLTAGCGSDADVLLGLDAFQERLELLAKDLHHECLAMLPGGAQSREGLEALRALDEEALGRGVTLLALHHDSVRTDPAMAEYVGRLSEGSGEVRTAPMLPPRFLVLDRATALIPVDPDNTHHGVLCTKEPAVVATLCAVFFHTWETAIPLGAGLPAEELSAEERSLLRLLARGLTDEAAAKRLGVSLRTVRRRMSALMERLHARSRFEAGLKAGQLGWL
ncbi:helix-turn-helix transcriptional regulator [Streptomyces sp. LP11]|uniref:Helix-turn-helix transcriptional regulator n=1 Tax=Streptomyces pyxinicus TaxID=2970331 RepID=A0ABT2B952_9ACTN|nr:helix-turn-helix transcriptional regulator [Streptomyces sp. LP11]MCS0604936.1 helix-turn-helix transcriptional regulator [Streptomyces sp. LP11]